MVQEIFIPGSCEPTEGSPEGVELRIFVSGKCGAKGFSTGSITFRGNVRLPFHTHTCSEAITVLTGQALAIVEDRSYLLGRLDCLHVPAGLAHTIRNANSNGEMVAHWSLASPEPAQIIVPERPGFEERGDGSPLPHDPESIRRFANADVYEPSEGAWFRDLFAKRLGSVGICGGYGRFTKGSSLPCHTHAFDESITILTGKAACLVQGSRYELSGIETAFVPKGKPHRFLNNGDSEMEMLWVYAGAEPDRTVVNNQYCSGLMSWPS